MDSPNFLLGISHIFCSILIIAICIPLVLGKIPMNRLYGIRFKKAYESEENWYKINRYGGQQLIIWSVLLLIFGIITMLSLMPENRAFTSASAFAPLIVLIPTLRSYLYAKKL